jgi:hypothetical protein
MDKVQNFTGTLSELTDLLEKAVDEGMNVRNEIIQTIEMLNEMDAQIRERSK